MMENALPLPRPRGRRHAIGPDSVVAMLIFVVTELMFFAGLISAFSITRAAYNTWPPVGQPRLPVLATAWNSAALLASGVALFVAGRAFRREPRAARRPMLAALSLGAVFVCFQGVEWVGLIREGLTPTSSNHGAFFYLIVGLHAAHALAAIALLGRNYVLLVRGSLGSAALITTQVFWYFVVGVWPVLYLRVYL